MPSCGHCKKLLPSTQNMCKGCRSICYCSVTCQSAHAVVHRRTCNANQNQHGGWGPESKAMIGRNGPTGVSHGFKKLPPNSIGGIADDWTSDLPRNTNLYARAYERLIDSYRLRVEDSKLHAKVNIGIYQKGTNPIADFVEYVKMAKRRKLLPAWWNAQCDNQLLAMARSRVQTTTNKDKVVLQRGPFEPMVLRMMSEKIHGMPLHLRAA